MQPLILFAHGAGVPSSSDWMQGWARRLSRLGPVETFDYPYVKEGRKAPDRLPRLLAAHREALEGARARHPGRPVVLAGKSLGARVSAQLSLEEPGIAALVALGFPLVAGRSSRDELLRSLRVPAFFAQGSRDPLCPLDRLRPLLAELSVPTRLHVVEGGDHSLLVSPRRLEAEGRSQEQVDEEALAAIEGFFRELGLA